jgi:hypothetical protein
VEQPFPATADIVDELEKAQVPRQLFLRNATIGTQPGAKQRPETFQIIDVDFMKAISIFIPSIFTSTVIDLFVAIAPGG